MLDFWAFFCLLIPSALNFLVPGAAMHFAIPRGKPLPVAALVPMRRGALRIMLMFLLTILTAVWFENYLHLPAAVGMMAGLAYLQFFGYFLHRTHRDEPAVSVDLLSSDEPTAEHHEDNYKFDVFHQFARMEWDTLLFFYGIVLCVGGINFIGYLAVASQFLYGEPGPTVANVLVGLISALVDNNPVMFAILEMRPEMSSGQWLLVTLTAGVGGSLLAIGSAAGVALLGQAKGFYSFATHLRWTPAILLGYAAGIASHFWLNAELF